MIHKIKSLFGQPLLILIAVTSLSIIGIITMGAYGEISSFALRQIIWLCISLAVFFFAFFVDWRFLRKTEVLVLMFLATTLALLAIFLLANVTKGARSWFDLGLFAIQPVDPAKLVLIAILAKYFSRRHVEIKAIRHVIVSGVYALILFVLVLLQPDFGSAAILFFIWFGMILLSGISWKHLLAVFLSAVITLGLLWGFVFADYQKARIKTFVDPLTDTQGAGYNVYQSVIAIGSGGVLGKGIGYGTQSKLKFLPEYQTDFIFAAFAEEWGFVGVLLLFVLFGALFYRLIILAKTGEGNFEALFCMGFAIMLFIHILIHIGGNLGLIPVTGTTLPFLSYGGSHLVTEFLGLGIVASMAKRSRPHRQDLQREFLGVERVD